MNKNANANEVTLSEDQLRRLIGFLRYNSRHNAQVRSCFADFLAYCEACNQGFDSFKDVSPEIRQFEADLAKSFKKQLKG